MAGSQFVGHCHIHHPLPSAQGTAENPPSGFDVDKATTSRAAIAAEAVTFAANFQTPLVGGVVHDAAAVAHERVQILVAPDVSQISHFLFLRTKMSG